jgi:AraC family transcriptional regulator
MLNYRDKKLGEYHARLNRALDFICENIDQELSLQTIAKIAGFSPFHFHRIFTAMVDETINAYVRRIRLEKAAMMLVHNPFRSITEIALNCGFSSSSNFARSFKERFGVSASRWREGAHLGFRKIRQLIGKNGQAESKTGEDLALDVSYNSSVDHRVSAQGYWDPGMSQVWGKICKWAGARNLLGPQSKFIGISHDDPDVTPTDKCRYDACVTVPEGTKPEGEVSVTELSTGNYAVLRFEGKAEEIKSAYDFLYGKWMPKSSYQPADSPCYEVYLNDPDKDPEHKFIFDLCVPVKPL